MIVVNKNLINKWRETTDNLRVDVETYQLVSYKDAEIISNETIGNRIVTPSPFRIGTETTLIPLGIESDER